MTGLLKVTYEATITCDVCGDREVSTDRTLAMARAAIRTSGWIGRYLKGGDYSKVDICPACVKQGNTLVTFDEVNSRRFVSAENLEERIRKVLVGWFTPDTVDGES
jgi:hypothetical protein